MDRFFDWAILLVYALIIFILVRPGSKGPQLAEVFGQSMVEMMKAASGGGGWWSG